MCHKRIPDNYKLQDGSRLTVSDPSLIFNSYLSPSPVYPTGFSSILLRLPCHFYLVVVEQQQQQQQ